MNEPQVRDLIRGEVFAGRYKVQGEFGRGAYGIVYDVHDQMTDERMALKVLRPNRISLSSNRWREASALRRLHLPGVARLLDEGTVDGLPYVAMEYVDGEPFPGPLDGWTWEELRPVVERLLETLSLVHAEGVVHGDLKPSNVMIVDGKDVRLLDFGLATRTTANKYESGESGKGTPIYMAPELFSDGAASTSSDLFAVGTMIFEAITHRPFFPESSLLNWIRQLATEGPPRLETVLPDAPADAVSLVNALLERDRGDRPGSAGEALRILGGETLASGFSWMGSERRFKPIYEAITARHSLDVGGGRGVGATRAIREAVARARAVGVEIHEVPPGTHPFESLLRMESLDLLLPVGAPLDELACEARDAVGAALGAKKVFFATEELDDWSNEVLTEMRGDGCVIRRIRGTPRPPQITLEPWSQKALESLFLGIEIGLHLRSKPARILYERTLGWPGDVFEELRAWHRVGLVTVEETGFRTSVRGLQVLDHGMRPRPPLMRRSVDDEEADLLAWIRIGGPLTTEQIETLMGETNLDSRLEELARRRLIDCREGAWWRVRDVDVFAGRSEDWLEDARERLLTVSTSPRIRFEIALTQDDDRLLLEAGLAETERLVQLGEIDRAHAAYRATLTRLKANGSKLAVICLEKWAKFAMNQASAEFVEEVLWSWGDSKSRVGRLLELGRLAMNSPGPRTADAIDELGEFEDVEFEASRLSMLGVSLGWQSPRFAEATSRMEEVGRTASDPEVAEGILTVVRMRRAFELYRLQDFEGAAQRHLEAAAATDKRVFKLKNVINAGWALIDALAFERGRKLAEDHIDLAREVGDPHLELQVVVMLRFARYRSGGVLEPNDELLSVVSEVGFSPLMTVTTALETMLSLRAGDRERATRVSRVMAARWTESSLNWTALLVYSIHAFLSDREVAEVARAAVERCPYERMQAQILAFQSYCVDDDKEAEAMRERAKNLVPKEIWPIRLETVSALEFDRLHCLGQ